MVTVGVDVGGSGVRAALVYPDGSLGPICRRRLPNRSVQSVVDTIVEAIGQVTSEQSPVDIGVGVPGFVHQGRVIRSPNFPEWQDVPLSQALSDRLGIAVGVENDANAATMGAWHLSSRPPHLILLTLGTGVGGGVISHGQLLRGSSGTGAELGHIYVGGESCCRCGGRGCLETWCSTVGMVRRARERALDVADGRELIVLAEGGNSDALAVLEEAGQALVWPWYGEP
ncbi:MAG: ROK family protein, partial [Proteobacteria bacterium]|nr:ROK family protein [Pseudomonadota bacterium]